MKRYHTMTTIIINLIMLFISLLTNNFIILTSILIWNLTVAYLYNGFYKYKRSLPYLFSLALVTLIINSFFVQAGNTELITILGRHINLEVIVYALIMSYKILIVFVIFISLELMIDSDKAVSYFSNKLPKTSLMMLIGIKLIPNMENRLNTLKDIYTIRGLDYKVKGISARIKSSIPILSILLEDSLENSFDIAESCYIRGSLRGNRGIYEKEEYLFSDILVISMSAISFISYIIISKYYKVNFDIYNDFKELNMISIYSVTIGSIIILSAIINLLTIKSIITREEN